MKINIVFFYILLASLLTIQTIFTVFHGGLVVGNGYKISQLEQQKNSLAKQSTFLKSALAAHSSLLKIQDSSIYNEFTPLTQVTQVSPTTTVALR